MAEEQDRPHPDERVRARWERIRQAREESKSDKAADASTMQEQQLEVTIPRATWDEVVRLARIGDRADSHRSDEATVDEAGRLLQLLMECAPQMLQRHRMGAMVQALRSSERRQPQTPQT